MASADDSSPDLQRAVNRQGLAQFAAFHSCRLVFSVIERYHWIVPLFMKDAAIGFTHQVHELSPSFLHKNSLKLIVHPHEYLFEVQGLNDAHTADVLEMGIRSLLHLQIAELPTRMWYWLVQNYNPRNSTLYLADSTGLCITEDV
nr:hypothetical protein DM860_017426 [Ipomoea trifida]